MGTQSTTSPPPPPKESFARRYKFVWYLERELISRAQVVYSRECCSGFDIRIVDWFRCCLDPPYPFFKFTIVQIGIGNIGNVPLVLIGALCRDKSNPFGDTQKCNTDGTAYISFGQWVGAVIVYAYVFNMLAPPPEGTFDIDNGSLPLKSKTKVDGSAEQLPLLKLQSFGMI